MAASVATKAGTDDFPIVCETCLGPNPYVRMQKNSWGSACKVCERPFTSFHWRPAGQGTRPKKTEVCQTCARAKHVCQTCLLDLRYGLPVQVRDMSMAAGDRQRTVVPKSDGTREYAAAQSERAIATGDIDAIYNAPEVNDIAKKAKRTAPRYERNRARVCTFFLKGTCTRGLYCPYRHEKPKEDADDSLMDQNLRDRYYGVNDPVAAKILQKAGVFGDSSGKVRKSNKRGRGMPSPPEDLSIQTLFIGGVDEVVKEEDLRSLFSGHSGLSNLMVLRNKGIAFAEFKTRKQAESALSGLYGQHEINGARVFINWGRGNSSRRLPGVENHTKSSSDAPPSHRVQAQPIPVSQDRPRKQARNDASHASILRRKDKEEQTIKRGASDKKSVRPIVDTSLLTFPSVSNDALKDKSALPPI